MKLFVAGIPFDMDDQELKEIFSDYGTVDSAKVITDRETGKSRGFGFVELEDEAAKNAIAKLDGGELAGRKLTVKKAEDKKPGGGGGGFRGGSGGGGGFRGGGDRGGRRY
jgi:cold-inducible RNA-binding protein